MPEHIHSVIVSYDRAFLTEEAMISYIATVSISHSLVIVDNGSEWDTQVWLSTLPFPVVLLRENMYPGYATNLGWTLAPPQTTLYHRIDNDVRFLEHWCDEVVELFQDPTVGQVGIVAAGDEAWTRLPHWPVGGNSIIRRALYDAGLRYDDRPWFDGHDETPVLWADVKKLGYKSLFCEKPGIVHLDSRVSPHPDVPSSYHEKSHSDRGLTW